MTLFNKIPVFTVLIIVLVAISLSMLNVEDPSWNANIKSYGGLIISAILLVLKYVFKFK